MEQLPYISNNTELQYQGYAHTPLLWKGDNIYGLKQYEIKSHPSLVLNESINEKMRLGYRVERFISSDLRQQDGVELLAENIQIIWRKQTVGELDCLLIDHGQPIHLEIIYKLYLYDQGVGDSELHHWIGGNRRDTLIKKLIKLQKKQLPLLYKPSAQAVLKDLNLDINKIEQRVHFRAQLYVPYGVEVQFNALNKDCLKGFYLRPDELHRFSKNMFFIPNRHDWLVEPQSNAAWMDYRSFKDQIDERMKHNSYPLCWIRFPDMSMQKFFVVWWE